MQYIFDFITLIPGYQILLYFSLIFFATSLSLLPEISNTVKKRFNIGNTTPMVGYNSPLKISVA